MTRGSRRLRDAAGNPSPGRKQSVYIPDDMLADMDEQADRLDRSRCWIVRRAWEIAKAEIQSAPTEEK